MPLIHRALLAAGLLVALLGWNAWAADPVPLPCPPHCTVDPCVIAPERCQDQGGPIEPPPDDGQGTAPPPPEDDPCKWCRPCSRTPGPECLACCAQ